MPAFLSLKHISQKFGGVQALRDVSLTLRSGEIHGLAGENGSGKSTLIKVISGVNRPDAGRISIEGQDFQHLTPIDSIGRGIQVIYQDLALFPNLSVAENLALNDLVERRRKLVRWGALRAQARRGMERLKLTLDLDQPVGELPVAQRQLVAIARALLQDARLIIMDEPTSALTDVEVNLLREVMGQLRAQGIAILFVSHKLREMRTVCDRFTILRNGGVVAEGSAGDFDEAAIARHMIGRDLASPHPNPLPKEREKQQMLPREPRGSRFSTDRPATPSLSVENECHEPETHEIPLGHPGLAEPASPGEAWIRRDELREPGTEPEDPPHLWPRGTRPPKQGMGETASSADTTVLRVKNLSGPLLHGVSFELREGEILGVTGLLGSGQTDLCHALFGLESASSGLILIRGQPHTIRNPQDAMAAGIAYVPEDRLTEGLFLTQSVERNLVAARLDPVRDRRGWIRPAAITRHVDEWLAKLDIQAASGRMPVNALSGGNQQRVLLARWLATCPDILILNGPTVGVDVGSKEGIHRKLRALASEGMGIMMISDDLPELTQNCVRVLVMQEGRIVHEWKRGEDPDQLGRHLTSFACET